MNPNEFFILKKKLKNLFIFDLNINDNFGMSHIYIYIYDEIIKKRMFDENIIHIEQKCKN